MIKKSLVEISEEEQQKIRAGGIISLDDSVKIENLEGKVAELWEFYEKFAPCDKGEVAIIKKKIRQLEEYLDGLDARVNDLGKLEDTIADVDCTLGDRIDKLDETFDEVYEFYENFPADWTLEKQLKELAEETVKAAIEPIMKRQTLLKMDIDSFGNDLKLWVSNDERMSAETRDRLSKLDMDMKQRVEENRTHAYIIKGYDERLKLLSKNVASIYDEVTSIKDNTTTALAADNATLARHEKEMAQLETDINLLKKALS